MSTEPIRWSEEMEQANSPKRPTQHQGDLILAELVAIKVNQARELFIARQVRMCCYALVASSVSIVVMLMILAHLIETVGGR